MTGEDEKEWSEERRDRIFSKMERTAAFIERALEEALGPPRGLWDRLSGRRRRRARRRLVEAKEACGELEEMLDKFTVWL